MSERERERGKQCVEDRGLERKGERKGETEEREGQRIERALCGC